MIRQNRQLGVNKLIICGEHLAHNFVAQRVGKWKVAVDTWPTGYYYPDYCLGSCSLLSMESALALAEEALVTSNGNFTIEDIFLTGIIRIKADAGELTDGRGMCLHADNREGRNPLYALVKFYQKYCYNNGFQTCTNLSISGFQ